MNKSNFLISALLVASLAIQADAGEKSGKHKKFMSEFRYLNQMQEKLGLSDEQVEKIFMVNTGFRTKKFSSRNTPGAFDTLHDEQRSAMEKILNQDQQKKFEAMKKEKEGHKKADKRDPQKRYMFLKNEIDLTEEQIEKIFKVKMSYREKMFKVRKDRDAIKTFAKGMRDEIKTILTDEQKMKIKKIREEKRKNQDSNGGDFLSDN